MWRTGSGTGGSCDRFDREPFPPLYGEGGRGEASDGWGSVGPSAESVFERGFPTPAGWRRLDPPHEGEGKGRRRNAMAYEFVEVQREGPVTTVILNRPEVMNALHSPAHFELAE